METVDAIYAGHGESPDQGRIQSEGNSFPALSYINSATLVSSTPPKDEA